MGECCIDKEFLSIGICSVFFSRLYWGYVFWRGRHRCKAPFSSYYVKVPTMDLTFHRWSWTWPPGWSSACQGSPLYTHPLFLPLLLYSLEGHHSVQPTLNEGQLAPTVLPTSSLPSLPGKAWGILTGSSLWEPFGVPGSKTHGSMEIPLNQQLLGLAHCHAILHLATSSLSKLSFKCPTHLWPQRLEF